MKKAFYAEEINRSTNPQNGDISNVVMRLGSSCFMISQARGEFMDMRTAFYLFVDNVDKIHQSAESAGGKVVFEPADMDYEDRQSGVKDPDGNFWWISKRLVKKGYHE